VDNIDVEAAQHGIIVVNAGRQQGGSQLTISFTWHWLGGCHETPAPAVSGSAQSSWLRGARQDVPAVGLGRIGTEVARRARGLK
jgi:phosphoglycerate dehydrogenase-like enzyme